MTMTLPGPSLVLPRFGTPRNLGRPTFGAEVGEVAKRLGKPLMPWQQHAVDVALEYDPDTGDLVYEEVDLTVPRQSGKTTLILALLVWRSIAMSRRLGDPQTSTYIAQSGKMARRKLEREFIPILRRSKSLREVPHSRARPQSVAEWKPSMNNGSEHILFGTGSYLQIDAPTEKGGHGDVLDMPVIDEAFAREDDLVEQALDAAAVTRRSPQLYVVSTAGTERSWYLWRKVQAGRRAVAADTESRVCYLEWSLPEEAAFDDEDAWREYLPALGHTITLERLRAKLEKALRNPDEADDDEEGYVGLDGFRRGYLNQWPNVPTARPTDTPVKLPAEQWSRLSTSADVQGSCVVGFEVSLDGEWSSIVFAAGDQRAPYVQQLVHRAGTSWLPEEMARIVTALQPSRVAHVGAGAALSQSGAVRLALSEAGLRVDVEALSMSAYRAACQSLFLDVTEGRLRWFAGSGPLDAAARDAGAKSHGEGWAWAQRNALTPVAPLVAATVARALLPVEVVREARPAQLYSW